jgi:hypothetical protein
LKIGVFKDMKLKNMGSPLKIRMRDVSQRQSLKPQEIPPAVEYYEEENKE